MREAHSSTTAWADMHPPPHCWLSLAAKVAQAPAERPQQQ